jgi:alcohol dehydrogenase
VSDKNLSWSFYNPVKVITAEGALDSLAGMVPAGDLLLVTDSWFTKSGTVSRVREILKGRSVEVYDAVLPNPELEAIDTAFTGLRDRKFSCVIALGGGSVMDTAKALAVLLADTGGSTLDAAFRGKGKPGWSNKLFLIAVPTTAGTGSEVTPFATIWDSVTGKKFSMAGDFVFPSIALLDPALTMELPDVITLNTGLDSISHALESLWNRNRTPVSAGFSIDSLRLALEALPALIKGEKTIELRAKMQWASTLAGMAISQTRTAIAHSISYPVTLKLGVPHGLAAGFTLTALIDRYLENPGNDVYESALLKNIREFLISLDMPKLVKNYGRADDFTNLISEMYEPSRADNYLFPVDVKFFESILAKSL